MKNKNIFLKLFFILSFIVIISLTIILPTFAKGMPTPPAIDGPTEYPPGYFLTPKITRTLFTLFAVFVFISIITRFKRFYKRSLEKKLSEEEFAKKEEKLNKSIFRIQIAQTVSFLLWIALSWLVIYTSGESYLMGATALFNLIAIFIVLVTYNVDMYSKKKYTPSYIICLILLIITFIAYIAVFLMNDVTPYDFYSFFENGLIYYIKYIFK